MSLSTTASRIDTLTTITDGKADLSLVNDLNLTVDGLSTEISTMNVTIDGVKSDLSEKQPLITGAATSIDSENLAVSKALVSDSNGKVAVSSVTTSELNYLKGVTSTVQTQLNNKASQQTVSGLSNRISKLESSTDTSWTTHTTKPALSDLFSYSIVSGSGASATVCITAKKDIYIIVRFEQSSSNYYIKYHSHFIPKGSYFVGYNKATLIELYRNFILPSSYEIHCLYISPFSDSIQLTEGVGSDFDSSSEFYDYSYSPSTSDTLYEWYIMSR